MCKNDLATCCIEILNSKTTVEEYTAVHRLADFLRSHSHYFNHLNSIDKTKETTLNGGIALSPHEAATCLQDYIRTARFIKGNYAAIKELLSRFPHEKINILYAGCGPFAVILLPLLPLLKGKPLSVVLLDVNEHSIRSVTELIAKFQVEHAIHSINCQDAILYKQDPSFPLHLVIAETMFNALTKEPQVSITANLAPQLTPNGIFIPEEITLDLVYAFFSEQPFLKEGANSFSSVNKTTCVTSLSCKQETLFSMNIGYNFSDKVADESYQFESSWYTVPVDFKNIPDICLFTTIRIYKDVFLNPFESYITNPHCVASFYALHGYSKFKLIYNFKNTPNWNYQC